MIFQRRSVTTMDDFDDFYRHLAVFSANCGCLVRMRANPRSTARSASIQTMIVRYGHSPCFFCQHTQDGEVFQGTASFQLRRLLAASLYRRRSHDFS